MFIAVTPKLGVSTFPEFVALAKSRPGQIAIGTNGAGTLPHFSGLAGRKRAAFRSPWSQVVEGHTGRCDENAARAGIDWMRERYRAAGQTPQF